MYRNDSVQTNPQADYLHYYNDGLLDIFIGVGIFTIGIAILLDISYVFIAILPAILIPVWRDAKKKYTAPRMKTIHFTEADRVARKTTALLTGLLLAGMLIFLVSVTAALFWSQATGLLPFWLRTFVKEYFWLLLSSLGALILCGIALLYKLKRYFVYAALTLAIFTITNALIAPFWLMIALTGITIALIGLVALLRFVQDYPI